MIYTSLRYVQDLLNESFRNEFSISENKVILSNLINPDGNAVGQTEDKIVFFLLNLEEESTLKNNSNRYANVDSSFTQRKPTIHLNINLIFCANFIEKNYEEGLKYLSAVIRFFQNNNRLKPNVSGKNKDVNRLLFEMCRLDYSELSHVWSAIGSKILPAVIYKVRVIAMEDASVRKVIPAVKNPKKLS